MSRKAKINKKGCLNPMYGKPSAMRGKKHRPESIKKMSDIRKRIQLGKKNPNWKGGVTPLNRIIHNSRDNAIWRLKVFARDEWMCQTCKKKFGGGLEAHHILAVSKIMKIYNLKTWTQSLKCKILWDTNNGVTLCRNCHELTDSYKARARRK